MQKKWIVTLSFVLMVFIIGCAIPAIPFLDSAPAVEAAPTMIDADTLATLVADRTAEKVAQTLEAAPPTTTPLPTATVTPPPSPTPTEAPPTATPTPMPSPTAVEYPSEGSDLIENESGQTTYFDYTAGYQIELPLGWLALRPGEAEYTEAWGLPIATHNEITNALQNMQSLDSDNFRLFLFDAREGHFEDKFLSNINFVLSAETGATLEEAFAATVLQLPESIPGLVVTDSLIAPLPGQPDDEVGIIYAEWDTELASGQAVRIYQQQVIRVLKNRSLIITFSSTVDFKDTLLPEFEVMLDTFKKLPEKKPIDA